MPNDYETVIGLEVHARIQTRTKIFCGCPTSFGAPPNSQVCPVCLGYPGALPVLNRRAVELAVRAAIATGCVVHSHSIFARKNYFYPDLPKGYQISQFDEPLATDGVLEIDAIDGPRRITIRRIHMEEDAGKLLHETSLAGVSDDVSLVDLNRAGVPLIEIVSEPEMRSADEAQSYFSRLRQILMYLGVCDGNMEEGSLRCDANISIRRPGEPLGTRSEIKNLNSFRFLGRAIEYETQRQIERLERGDSIVQETRLWDAVAGETRSMRSKEEAHDYRYFPDPDLPPLQIDQSWIDEIRLTVPRLPAERIAAYGTEWEIARDDAEVLVATRELSEYFEATVEISREPRLAANWVRNDVLRVINETKTPVDEFLVRPSMLADLLGLVRDEVIGGRAAKEVFDEMAETGKPAREIVERRGLAQVSDQSVIRAAAVKVLAENSMQLTQYRNGKTNVFGFLVGQLMKEMRGKAKADLANSILRELVDSEPET